MEAIRKILVPVDFSDRSRKAIEYALGLADVFGASVDVLHVGMRPAEYLPLDKWIWGEEHREHDVDNAVREAARTAFDRFIGALSKNQRDRLNTKLTVGTPHKVITDRATAEGYDLIVMATHGRTGHAHVLLGSVAERVLRHAPCPVLTVR